MFVSEKLKKFKNLRHCFFSRKNGVSEGIYKSLNCGLGSNDVQKNVLKNLEIVSKKISESCYPITIKMGKEMKNCTLVLNVLHGKELEIEYAKKEIIDKINSFFGYNCISQVTLKIVQEKIKDQLNFLKLKIFQK